jgi:aconitase B
MMEISKEKKEKKNIIFTGRIQEISGVQMECLDRPVRLFRNKIW